LVDNAITHGGGEICFSVRGTSEALTFEVEDSGEGVPPSERERIFEAFRQGNASGVEHAGGSGLGLAIVREIAQAHGGNALALDGTRGTGALFRITLPRTATESLGADPETNA
ncbi:MAG: sensor histidine kinase, partial [Planctomycetota bacterium]